ncbi:MAG: RNA-directed DNA polymerase [Candidatus Peregrinibacteria bacterium]
MPIGNLTSQIFANIYLNELDRFIKHELKIKNYLRYGDDFILIEPDLQKLKEARTRVIHFLGVTLKLGLNSKHDRILKPKHGLKFLGVMIYHKGIRLTERNRLRVKRRLNLKNAASYFGLLKRHENPKKTREFFWELMNLFY